MNINTIIMIINNNISIIFNIIIFNIIISG